MQICLERVYFVNADQALHVHVMEMHARCVQLASSKNDIFVLCEKRPWHDAVNQQCTLQRIWRTNVDLLVLTAVAQCLQYVLSLIIHCMESRVFAQKQT